MQLRSPLAYALICSLIVCLHSTSASAADGLTADTADLVKASLLADVEAISPDGEFMLGVHLKMKPHWHTYWINPGESGEATKIKLTGPAGVTFGKVQWPLPRAIESFGAITYGYEDEVLLLVPVKVAGAKAGGKVTIDAHAIWLACHDTCIEGEAKLSITLPVGKTSGANQKQFEQWRKHLPAGTSSSIAAIEQKKLSSAPQPAIVVEWNDEVKKVEWFPIGTPAVAIENVVVKHEGKRTAIAYKPTVYKADKVPGGKVEGVIVFEDAKGHRQGVMMSFLVPLEE